MCYISRYIMDAIFSKRCHWAAISKTMRTPTVLGRAMWESLRTFKDWVLVKVRVGWRESGGGGISVFVIISYLSVRRGRENRGEGGFYFLYEMITRTDIPPRFFLLSLLPLQLSWIDRNDMTTRNDISPLLRSLNPSPSNQSLRPGGVLIIYRNGFGRV